MTDREAYNGSRFTSDNRRGHYESWFQRANHPTLPRAFWLRYTIFSPRGRPGDAVGELWAAYFDGDTRRVVAVRRQVPVANCAFGLDGLSVRIDDAVLDAGQLKGESASGDDRIAWELSYEGREPPLLLLKPHYYTRAFPKAKAVVGSPNARFTGRLVVNGEAIDVSEWQGSQNHNWGSAHTDHYAWGQVAGFDDAPDAFLECVSGRLRMGPVWTPTFTLLVLRLDGQEWALNSLGQALAARGRFSPYDWRLRSRARGVEIAAHFHGPDWSFAALRYGNPAGGSKVCLNSKIATCELTVSRPGHPPRVLRSANRAAFEILMDTPPPGVSIVA